MELSFAKAGIEKGNFVRSLGNETRRLRNIELKAPIKPNSSRHNGACRVTIEMKMQHIDITQEKCPMTWVRVKLKLESMARGELLEVKLKGEGPVKNVPRSATEDEHEIVSLDSTSEISVLTLKVKGLTL
jgi:tRNA 2-thiouridine synthesizing protein A